jgi:integrase
MAGVRKLPSGTWQGWHKHYEGHRAFITIGRTATKQEVRAPAQALEVQHAQIRLGVRPRPDHHSVMLARQIGEVIEEYLAWGQLQGGRGGRPWTPKHQRQRATQLAWWQTHLHLRTLEDCINILPSVERLLQGRDQQGRSSQTLKHERNALAAFLAWCTTRGYLERDPLRGLSPLHVTPRSTRRALTSEESRTLLSHCPPPRRLLYETAMVTGLRVNELRQLTIDHLDFEQCGLRLDAAWTKNRQPDFQPLSADLLRRLYDFSRAGEPQCLYGAGLTRMVTPVNALLYVPHNVARKLAHDLQHDGIRRQTAKGKIDFHALRTTYINLVIASGATVPEAQELARHRTAALTIGVYGRSEERRLRQLVDAVADTILPDVERALDVHAQVVGDEYVQEYRGDSAEGSPPDRRLTGEAKNVPGRPEVQAARRRVAPQEPDGHSIERHAGSHYCSVRRGDGDAPSTQRHSGVFRHPRGGVHHRRRQYWPVENLGLHASSNVPASEP